MGESFCKFREKKDFHRENFCRLLTGAAKDATLPNFAEKTFTNSHKTSKIVKVFFFLQKFPAIKY